MLETGTRAAQALARAWRAGRPSAPRTADDLEHSEETVHAETQECDRTDQSKARRPMVVEWRKAGEQQPPDRQWRSAAEGSGMSVRSSKSELTRYGCRVYAPGCLAPLFCSYRAVVFRVKNFYSTSPKSKIENGGNKFLKIICSKFLVQESRNITARHRPPKFFLQPVPTSNARTVRDQQQ